MNFLALLVRRGLQGIVLLFAVVVFNFVLIRMAPGDAADYIAGQGGAATPEIMAAIRKSYGLDLPLNSQLATYLGKFVRGDLGSSFHLNQPVTTLILARLPASILLMFSALLLAIAVGTFLGIVSARKPNRITSHIVTILSLFGYAVPSFRVGIMLLILLAGVVPLFPAFGMRSAPPPPDLLPQAVDILHHLVLPAVTLAIFFVAQFSRLARAAMLEALASDYIRTARAKGLREGQIVYKHALRNAALPLITMAGLHFGNLFSGAVVVEVVFSWPGMGQLAYDSILRRDHPVLLGILIFAAVTVIVVNLLTDFACRLADPRIAGSRA